MTNSRPKVLLLGGTGAMGVYVVPELIRRGFQVDITSRKHRRNPGVNVRYITGDAHDEVFLEALLVRKYDVIIDFMVYSTNEFKARYKKLLRSTRHYIFLSTYRVFADSDKPLTEDSPRLLDVSTDYEYLQTDEYALSKARQEDLLTSSIHKNWTIVRPSITYSKERFQVGVFEAHTAIYRALEGRPIVFPKEMLDKQTTMTWAGDVARMISLLCLSEATFSQTYNVVTSETHTWREVISYYQEIISLKVKYVSIETLIGIHGNKYQVLYDRMYNRRLDNAKILAATNMLQSDLKELRAGLQHELSLFISKPTFDIYDAGLHSRIDAVTDTPFVMARKKLRIRSRIADAQIKVRPRTRLKSIRQAIRIRTRYRQASRNKLNTQKDGLIVSMNSVFNYGNVIQRYALNQVLERNGYKFDAMEISGWYDTSSPEVFAAMRDFTSRHLHKVPYVAGELQGYKNYIVGSDQVWRDWYNGEWSMFSPYFLEFVDSKSANKISYAASFGVDNLNESGIQGENFEKIRKNLTQFSAISVREESAVNLVHQIIDDNQHTDVSWVLDPTLLLTKEDYSQLIEEDTSKVPARVFSYLLDKTDSKETFIKNVSKSYGRRCKIINPHFDKRYEPVEEWLRGFRDAEFVVTDSFHGMVFAIVNQVDFIVFNNKNRGSERFTSLLDMTGINRDRLIEDGSDINIKQLEVINWKSVELRLASHRSKSISWLLSHLK